MSRLSLGRLFTAFLTLILTLPLAASGPTFWTVSTAADFLGGTSDGVYVTLAGVVTAGPSLSSRLTSTPAQVWSLGHAPDGTLWAGTGGDGRVVRLRPGQAAEETVFDAPEANIFALTATADRVYAASSPDGKVYVIEGNTPARVFFDPQEKYIWALALDTAGRLWVGAGNPAVVYRVAADGTSQVIYRPAAAHVVALTTDGSGRVLAGTESPGRLYRFDATDRPFVLLDTGLTELRAISADSNGVVYAAGVAKGEEAASGGETASVAFTLAPAPTGSTPASAAAARRSVLYRIETSGVWEEWWSSSDVIFDIAAQADGSVLAATGPEGRLYRVDATRDVRLFTGVDARQVTRFASAARATPPVAFATANPGRVVALGSGVQSPATYISTVRDTKSVATWGQVRWDATGTVTLASRSGNTERPDDSWSDWSAPYNRREGETVISPAARFIQWRAVLTRAPSGNAATLTSVTLAYLPRNNRPQVSSLTVHPPGVVFQRPFVNDESAIAGLDAATAEARRAPGDAGPPTPAPGRRFFQQGLQTIAWKAEDQDDDNLSYTLLFRREGDATWRTLRTDLTDSIFVWDTTTVSDGRYLIRVRASDLTSNAAERALSGDRDSDPIEVDNTPPTLTIEVVRSGAATRLTVRVLDARSPIQTLEYSVGGAAWVMLYPVDGLADSPDERYDIPLTPGVGPTDVVIRASDLLRNVVSQPAAR